MLRGREKEREALDLQLLDVRSGRSRALVICGEPGIGKAVLLEDLRERVGGVRVDRVGSVEAEAELGFARLYQLCAQTLGRLDRLPVPQREALRVAFGLSLGGPPHRFLVGLALLGLLADLAPNTPIPGGEGSDRICPERLLDHIPGGRGTGVHEGYR